MMFSVDNLCKCKSVMLLEVLCRYKYNIKKKQPFLYLFPFANRQCE